MEEAAKEKKITEIGSAIEELSVLSIAKTTIVTTETEATSNIINLPLKPLLSFCKLIIQVLGIYSRINITKCYAVFVSFPYFGRVIMLIFFFLTKELLC